MFKIVVLFVLVCLEFMDINYVDNYNELLDDLIKYVMKIIVFSEEGFVKLKFFSDEILVKYLFFKIIFLFVLNIEINNINV